MKFCIEFCGEEGINYAHLVEVKISTNRGLEGTLDNNLIAKALMKLGKSQVVETDETIIVSCWHGEDLLIKKVNRWKRFLRYIRGKQLETA